VDANGILNVSALDKSSGRKQQMKVTPTSGLAPDEIERMIAEAEQSAEADRRAKELIGQRTKLDSLVRNTQRTLREFGNSLTNEERQAAQHTLLECEELAKSEDFDELQEGMQKAERLAAHIALALLNPATEGGAKDHNERL
jgi:molecular chaperone DnaK